MNIRELMSSRARGGCGLVGIGARRQGMVTVSRSLIRPARTLADLVIARASVATATAYPCICIRGVSGWAETCLAIASAELPLILLATLSNAEEVRLRDTDTPGNRLGRCRSSP